MDRTPRAEKVAVVDEVRERFNESSAVLVTEYRGISVAAMAQLRRNLREAGGDYKVYKNTLVRLAVSDLDVEGFSDLLVGPTALAFVSDDAAAVAKALKDFAGTNDNLVIKGALLSGQLLDESQVRALANLPSRDELLAKFAGGLQAPMSQMAALLNATMAKFAYGVQALIDAGGAGGGDASSDAPADEAVATEAPAEEAPAEEAPVEDAPAEEAAAPDTEADGGDDTDGGDAEADAEAD